MIKTAKSILRALAYQSGLLGLAHRLRNRHTLTVFMFHRVLPADSVAYAYAEKEFTFTVAGFGLSLDFIQKHYNVVSHADIRAQIDHGVPLPPRAGLITFDDGWRDTLLHALPELKSRHLPAVLFLATEVLDLKEDRWWQDMLVEAIAHPHMLEQLEQALGIDAAPLASAGDRHHRLTRAISGLDDPQRHSVLSRFVSSPPMGRQMFAARDLADWPPLLAIAGHGHSHGPLTQHPAPAADLATSHARLKDLGVDHWAMSFPHGAVDDTTLALARQAGFHLCYSSEAALVNVAQGIHPDNPLGRIHIPENEWTCEHGQISFPRLASFLFFRPIAP